MDVSSAIWYNGSVKNAIEQVKTANSLLLVFIQGDDEVSNKYEAFFHKGIPLEPKRYTALKILRNSKAFEQFKEIYVTVPVPSVFLIGSNGRPLSIVSSEEPHNLPEALKEAAEKQKKIHDEAQATEKPKKTLPENARIQFRLPSDEVRSWDFPSKSTLRDVKLYLMETVHLGPGFKLLRVYPRTTFAPEDDAKTLEDLSLTPNATLIVIPVQGAIQTSIKSMIAHSTLLLTYFAALLKPVLSIISYFKRFLSGSGPKKFKPRKREWNETAQKRFCKKNSANNIHSFTFNDSDSDSDMNTDNGNSTQQM